MGKRMNLNGQRFGRLIVLREGKARISSTGKEYRTVICKCDCGNTKQIFTSNLTGNKTRSCGCIHGETVRTHGLGKHPLYYTWHCMKKRCYNSENEGYKNYGGRGIMICDEWLNDFKVFYDWAMINGYKKGLEIDRRDNDGNYEPTNCRFVTRRKNALNQRLLYSSNTSGYRGVCWMNGSQQWRAYIKIKNKPIILGLHVTKELAIQSRNNYIIENNLQHEYEIQTIKTPSLT